MILLYIVFLFLLFKKCLFCVFGWFFLVFFKFDNLVIVCRSCCNIDVIFIEEVFRCFISFLYNGMIESEGCIFSLSVEFIINVIGFFFYDFVVW